MKEEIMIYRQMDLQAQSNQMIIDCNGDLKTDS